MKREIVVSNAGPLIYLSVIHRFSLLGDFFSTVLVPEAVSRKSFSKGMDNQAQMRRGPPLKQVGCVAAASKIELQLMRSSMNCT
jgi:predicted nucleic acid-binding protein